MLPKIEHPLFTEIVPSTKKKLSLRPMLVREEKVLLMAKEAKETNSIILAIKQIVNNCVSVSGGFDVDKLTIFDLDYLFIKVRAASIDNKIKLSFVDDADEPVEKKLPDGKIIRSQPTYDFEVDLNDVTIKWPEDTSTVIQIDNESGINLKYPQVSVYDSPALASATNAETIVEEMIIASFDSYFKGSKVYPFKDETREAISEFIDSLDVGTYAKVVKFFETMPTVFYECKFTNTKGEEKTQTLSKLTDFFIF